MKILTIDDQQLILLSVEKRLTELGYDVILKKYQVPWQEAYPGKQKNSTILAV